MTGLAVLWLPILVSSVLVFVVSSAIHMASPWHKSDYPKVPNEDRLRDPPRLVYDDPGVRGRGDLRAPAGGCVWLAVAPVGCEQPRTTRRLTWPRASTKSSSWSGPARSPGREPLPRRSSARRKHCATCVWRRSRNSTCS